MKYSAENLLALFDIESKAVDPAEARKIVRGAGEVINYCIKTIRSGNQIEVEGYPIWSTAPIIPGDPQSRKSAEAISRANDKNARKHFERKMNANFTDDDYRIDLTYADDYLPDADQAWKDVRNYLRRVKYACRKQGLPPPKYMGVSEGRREGSKQKRVHHHIVIACGLSRDELEAIWKKGRVRADRLQADRYGYAALAKYMMKEPEGAKRYFCSRNLKEPKVTISGTRISFRKVEQLVVDVEENAPEIFQKMYKGCEYLDCVAKRTKYVSGMYIYARLRVPERKPKKRKGRKP